jgi:hypothetical protein
VTLWAGAYARDPRGQIPPALATQLAQALSRAPNEQVLSTRFDRAVIVHAELGAFSSPSVRSDPASVTVVAGEPFLATDSARSDRDGDLAALHGAWSRRDLSLTARTVGTFAAVHYDDRAKTLTLIADKLGVRPIYFAVTDDVVVVANALRIIEAIPSVPKVLDVRGAVESVALGYPLADRTVYREVYAIRDGEIVTFRDRAVERRRYWCITDVGEDRAPLDDAARRAYEAFRDAVSRRAGSDRRGVAFLSGGLDSRCVVAELCRRGIEVQTFNFANEGTQDQLLGDAFADVIGTIHMRTPRPLGPVRWSLLMAERWAASPHRARHPVERPGMIWSGDGGSVGFGFVGVYPDVIALLRAGKRDEAVERYCVEHGISLPLRVFRRKVAHELRDILHVGLREAFDQARSDREAGQDLYVFRMQHDQRRHLVPHFEDADLHRLELHLPFYDAGLIEVIAAAPADYGVGHRLYSATLEFFPAIVREVPWQTYPGHVPCPLPLPHAAIDQWGDDQNDLMRRSRRRGILREATALATRLDFPSPLLDRRYVIAAGILHWLGRADYSYVMDYATTFSTLWSVSQRRWSLDARQRSNAATPAQSTTA